MRNSWLIAAALGVFVGGTVFVYVQWKELEARGGEKTGVVVLNESLEVGSSIQKKHLGVRDVPSAWVDDRTVRKKHREELVGLTLSVAVARGQSLQWSDFEERSGSSRGDLAVVIPPGYRALAIPVSTAISLGGLLRPGHRVDILGTFAKGTALEKEKSTRTLLQNISVLAIGTDMDGSAQESRFGTVTLSVTVVQGELLAFASSIGSLSLVLRGYSDMQITEDVPEIGMAEVLRTSAGGESAPGTNHTSSLIEQLRVSR